MITTDKKTDHTLTAKDSHPISNGMGTILYWIKRAIPKSVLELIRPPYHFLLAWLGAVIYRQPSKDLVVIGVTGTKGKSTVVELITAILEADLAESGDGQAGGKSVATLSTIHFKIGERDERNLYKMTLPGRFFLQRFLREAVDAECTHAVVEMTSEGAKQFRHKFVHLDALVFTNLTPEHIESHGSFQNYKAAKLAIAKQLEVSKKRPRYIVANTDNEHGEDFLKVNVEEKLPYNLKSLKLHTLHRDGVGLIFTDGTDEVTVRVPLVGLFNVYNALAAVTLTRALGVSLSTIESALRSLPPVKGRVEHFYTPKGVEKQLTAIVDYAHTPDSLEQLYRAFKDYPKVAVLGKCGGGRDRWSAPEMAHLAEQYCDYVILTDEDPYDDDPREIVEHMATGIEDKSKLTIIMDRREAIAEGLRRASDGGYVMITGKDTDPYIMRAHNQKEPWSDAEVVQEEIAKLFGN